MVLQQPGFGASQPPTACHRAGRVYTSPTQLGAALSPLLAGLERRLLVRVKPVLQSRWGLCIKLTLFVMGL